MSHTIQVRVNPKTKRAVGKIFAELGLDMSTGIKIYFSQVLKTGGVPFPLLTENGFTPEQENKLLAIARQTEADYASGKLKAYSSLAEMRKDILSR